MKMGDLSPHDEEKLSEAIQRFVRVEASVTALTLQYLRQSEPQSELARTPAEDHLKWVVGAVLGRFTTADGKLGREEALSLARLVMSARPSADLSEAAADVFADIMDEAFLKGYENMGAVALGHVTYGVKVLRLQESEEAAREYAAATIHLAEVTCDLDGRNPDEDRALREFESTLQEALAAPLSSFESGPIRGRQE